MLHKYISIEFLDSSVIYLLISWHHCGIEEPSPWCLLLLLDAVSSVNDKATHHCFSCGTWLAYLSVSLICRTTEDSSYQGTMKCICEQTSTTRRSAGIPALITGILASNSKNPSFQTVFSRLKAIANEPVQRTSVDETNVPQVHAINSIREIFKSSVLSKRALDQLVPCLQIAADALETDM